MEWKGRSDVCICKMTESARYAGRNARVLNGFKQSPGIFMVTLPWTLYGNLEAEEFIGDSVFSQEQAYQSDQGYFVTSW